MNVKPGIVTQEEFDRILFTTLVIFLTFIIGAIFGFQLHRCAIENATQVEHVVYPHDNDPHQDWNASLE